MISKNALIFPKLTWVTLLIALCLRTTNRYVIYYIETSDFFRKRLWIINYYDKRNIKWIKKQYVDFSDAERFYFLAVEFADKIFSRVNSACIIKEVNKRFPVQENHQDKMNVLWKRNIYDSIRPFAHQYAAAEYLIKEYNYCSVILIAYNSLARFLENRTESNIKIVVFPVISFLSKAFIIIKKSILIRLSKVFTERKRKSSQSQNNLQEYNKRRIDVEKFKVAFFPHQGVFYGNLFIKDHFYNEDSESPFSKSRILHMSLRERALSRLPSIVCSNKYYAENNIPHMDSIDLSCSNRKLLVDCIKLLSNVNSNVLCDIYKYGLDFMMMVLFAYCKLRLYCSVVSHLKNLKVALVGYDVLFPCELSVALSLSGVKVCASQERLHQAFWPFTYLILDYYFVAGEVVVERGLKNSYIGKCIPVGLVRVDKIFEYEKKNIFDEKYDVIKKARKLVLALDYHMPEDDYDNIDRPIDMSKMREFYNNLINLALEFPSLHIVIKGKNTESYESPFIADIVEKINNTENINIELDLEKYNPYYLSEKADLTIACYTSLADELLAAGRKVIFYEMSDYLETFFDYGNLPIVVKDYEALKYHVQDFLNGIWPNEESINKLKEGFYSNCFHGNVGKQISSTLGLLITTL